MRILLAQPLVFLLIFPFEPNVKLPFALCVKHVPCPVSRIPYTVSCILCPQEKNLLFLYPQGSLTFSCMIVMREAFAWPCKRFALDCFPLGNHEHPKGDYACIQDCFPLRNQGHPLPDKNAVFVRRGLSDHGFPLGNNQGLRPCMGKEAKGLIKFFWQSFWQPSNNFIKSLPNKNRGVSFLQFCR